MSGAEEHRPHAATAGAVEWETNPLSHEQNSSVSLGVVDIRDTYWQHREPCARSKHKQGGRSGDGHALRQDIVFVIGQASSLLRNSAAVPPCHRHDQISGPSRRHGPHQQLVPGNPRLLSSIDHYRHARGDTGLVEADVPSY